MGATRPACDEGWAPVTLQVRLAVCPRLMLLVLVVMTYHLWAYERGKSDQAATDFAITLAGILYVGWLGSYMISLRDMPDGLWWFLIVPPGVAAIMWAHWRVLVMYPRPQVIARRGERRGAAPEVEIDGGGRRRRGGREARDAAAGRGAERAAAALAVQAAQDRSGRRAGGRRSSTAP